MGDFCQKKTALVRPCAVCGRETGLLLGTLSFWMFDDSPIAPEFDVTACDRCGLVTCNTPSTQGDYDRYYAEQNYSPAYMQKTLRPFEREYFDESVGIISRIVQDSQAEVVDVGCGLGFLLEGLATAGYRNIFGLDASAACVDHLNREKGIRAFRGTIFDPVPVTPSLVTAFHIIEHLVEAKAAVRRLWNILPEGGRILVEVPNTKRLDEVEPAKPLGYFYFTHVLHLDARHLKNLFVANGFRCRAEGFRLRREQGLNMPCVWALFEKGESERYVPDFSLARKIKGWFDAADFDPSGELQGLSREKRPVYVWGMGIHAQMYLGMSELKNCSITALVDKNPNLRGKHIGRWPVQSSDILAEAGKEDAVVITTIVHQSEMKAHLKEIGFKGKIVAI